MTHAELLDERATMLELLERYVVEGDRQRAASVAERINDIDKRIARALSGVRLKVYFAGSIRGGRVDATLYRRMIERIRQSCDVLTEHVGNLELNVLEQGSEGDAAIYQQDTDWLRACDLVIAECTCPSLGVGYELAFAEAHHKPAHVFYDRTKTQLSAMIAGDHYFHVLPYDSEQELFRLLDQLLDEL